MVAFIRLPGWTATTLDTLPEHTYEDEDWVQQVLLNEPWRLELKVGLEVAVQKASIREWFKGKVVHASLHGVMVEFIVDKIPNRKTLSTASNELRHLSELESLIAVSHRRPSGVPARSVDRLSSGRQMSVRHRFYEAPRMDLHSFSSPALLCSEVEQPCPAPAATLPHPVPAAVKAPMEDCGLAPSGLEQESRNKVLQPRKVAILKTPSEESQLLLHHKVGSGIVVWSKSLRHHVEAVITDIANDRVKIAYQVKGKLRIERLLLRE